MAESTEIPYGFCRCGCGRTTRVATRNDPRDGSVKGEPVRYVSGHHRRLRLAPPNPSGLCMCGCGQETSIAEYTNQRRGLVGGERKRYVNGHFRLGRRFVEVEPPNPSGLCMCGCGEKTALAPDTLVAKGVVAGEPQRYVHGHNSRAGFDGPRWVVDSESGCWVWQRRLNAGGYGVLCDDGTTRVAHRVVYVEAGRTIPEGMHLHHTCHNRACVNPDHLEPMEPEEHSRHHADSWPYAARAKAAA